MPHVYLILILFFWGLGWIRCPPEIRTAAARGVGQMLQSRYATLQRCNISAIPEPTTDSLICQTVSWFCNVHKYLLQIKKGLSALLAGTEVRVGAQSCVSKCRRTEQPPALPNPQDESFSEFSSYGSTGAGSLAVSSAVFSSQYYTLTNA